MRYLRLILILLIPYLLLHCNTDTSSSKVVSGEIDANPENTATTNKAANLMPDCKPAAKILEGNSLLIRELGLAVFIAADSTTYHTDFGDSHRLLITMDIEKCEEVDRKVLPENLSPDFPYHLANISYHRQRKVIAIKGLKAILCYDLETKSVFGPVYPTYKNEREYADAQSGNIQRLEIWEDYIIGYATDLGAFAFFIEADNSIIPYLPLVEFPGDGWTTGALFLIPTTDAKVQAIIPSMEDQPPYGFSIETLFEQPIELSGTPLTILPNFVILGQTTAGEQVLIDLKRKKRVDLPDNLKQAAAAQIAEWVKGNS